MYREIKCGNCKTDLNGKFCSNCGQKSIVGKLNIILLFKDFLHHALDLEAPFFKTIIDLTLRPGIMIKNYVEGQRVVYSSPLQYFFLVMAAYYVLFIWFDINIIESTTQLWGIDSVNNYQKEIELVVSENIRYYIFLLIPIFALSLTIFRPDPKCNFTDYLVMSFYTITHIQLLCILIMPFYHVSHIVTLTITYLIDYCYSMFMLNQFMTGRFIQKMIRANIIYFSSTILWYIVMILITGVIVVLRN